MPVPNETAHIKRYTADIEIPDGIISVDCEMENGEKTEILFSLNGSSLQSPDPTSESFRNLLENSGLKNRGHRHEMIH